MVTEKQVRDFLKMSVFQKAKLQQENPVQYNELKTQAAKQFNPNSDPEAAKELASKK